jgi:hypothetical protein
MKDYNGVQGKAGEVNSTKASITNVAPSCWVLLTCAMPITRKRTSWVRDRGLFTTRPNKTWHSVHITSWVHRADCAVRPDTESVLRLCNEQHCCVSQDLQFASFTHSLLHDWFRCKRAARYWVAATVYSPTVVPSTRVFFHSSFPRFKKQRRILSKTRYKALIEYLWVNLRPCQNLQYTSSNDRVTDEMGNELEVVVA